MEMDNVVYQKVSSFKGRGEFGESHKMYRFGESVHFSEDYCISVRRREW